MNRIKELRIEKGILQSDLAKRLKMGQATVSNWETGRHEPDQNALLEMSKIFDASIDYILGNSDIKKAPSLEDAGLSAEEAELLKLFRAAPEALQDAALRVLEANQRKE
nr:MAG TPA: helix-turn-helix domain protein [Caudoviricetes sp.]